MGLPILIRVILREHVDVPGTFGLIPRHQVVDAGLRKDQSLKEGADKCKLLIRNQMNRLN